MTDRKKRGEKKPKASKEVTTEIEQPIAEGKGRRIFENLLKTVGQFIAGRSYFPSTEKELLVRLSLPLQHKGVLQSVLRELRQQGVIRLFRGRYLYRGREETLVKGLMFAHPRGFGFVTPHVAGVVKGDIFIPAHLMGGAVHGDEVEVSVTQNETGPAKSKGPEGKVITVLKRARSSVAGIIHTVVDREAWAYVPMFGTKKRVRVYLKKGQEVARGDRVILDVIEWGGEAKETVCEYTRILGNISDPSCDIPAAIEGFGLRSNFPEPVVEEAKALGTRVMQRDIAGREDLRKIECFTIDPDTAKDYDDAVSLTKDSKGHYFLGVHIADVSHYVRPGTALDAEARLRCNSTYFPGIAIPMLPGELSNNLCSLREGVNRLTVSVLIEFDPNGEMLNHRIARSVICSQKRMTYRQAKEILDGERKSKHKATLDLMVEFCYLLKRKRYERGSLEFALPDLAIIVDEQGVPQRNEVIVYDITHQLIEEFMLKANEVIAHNLNNQGLELAYRVHDEPDPENISEFVSLARAFGHILPDEPSPADFQRLFNETKEKPYHQFLTTCYIRCNRLAIYSADNIGHYGLGLSHYCHFTSPIRRYVDLVIHRSLFDFSYAKEDMDIIAQDCSEKERLSARAEAHVVLLKKLRLLQSFQQQSEKNEEMLQQYEAIITRIRPMGFDFEVIDFMLEGNLHVAELDGDYYIFDERSNTLRGERTGETFEVSDRIFVMLKEVDLIYLQSRWHYVGKAELDKKPLRRAARGPSDRFSSERRPSKKRGYKRKSRHGR